MVESLNLLALDGGGIRGVSMLLILDEIMRRVQHDEGLASPPRPCEYFHLIGGTSTGGLIALMLGRLRMTTTDALRTYNNIAGAVFCKDNRKSFFKDGAFKATTLEKQVQALVAAKQLGEYILCGDNEAGSAKAFLCAVPATNFAHPRLFRSYRVRENASTNCKIWEAARATTAAPTFFKRMTIMDDGGAQEDFLDGGLRFNNPTQLVLGEALTIFGSHSKLGCLVSIGTGHPGTIGLPQPDAFQKVLPTEMVGVLKQIATNCEQTAHDLAKQFQKSPNRYFRYSVSYGVGTISLEEWKKMNEIQVHTKAYMEEVGVSNSIDKVVDTLCQASENRPSGPSLQSICQVVPESANKPTSTSPMKHQPLSSNLFTGREDFLRALEEYFIDEGPGSHLRREYLLYGMGGAGKTQIALKFAEKHRQRYEHVFWIDASNRDTLEHSYKIVALKIGKISNEDCSVEKALRELEFYQGRWLLLFDGADNLEDISGFWPPGIHGDIVYTSRNRMLQRLPEPQMQHVSEMNKGEASELLIKSAHLDATSEIYKQQALDIVTELGCLALAIDQAGAYILSGGCCLDDYLDIFSTHHRDLLQNKAYKGVSGNDRAVYATWDLSYSAIARQADSATNKSLRRGSKAALQILHVFPFFHNEGIMEDIFKSAAENSNIRSETELEANDRFLSALLRLHPNGDWESQSLRQGVQTLLSFSLIGLESSQRQFFMHRLVNLWAYDRLTAAEKDQYGNQARDILTMSIVWRFKTSDFAFRRDLLPHITASQRRTNSHLRTIGDKTIENFALVFNEAGRWKEAEELVVRVIETKKRVLGEEHPATLVSMGNLALTYSNQGQWREAEELEVRVMKIRKRVLGEEHPDTLKSMNNLALIYRNQGQWKEAKELMVRVMETSLRVLGEEHPDTLTSIANLALIYNDQGQWKKAEELMVRVLETKKRVLGEEHPNTLTSIANLASIYSDQGQWKEAEELKVRVMETSLRVLGKEHPDTLTSMSNLALIYWNQGQWKKAEKLNVRVMETRKRVLGEEHPDTLTSIANLALTYSDQGQWKETEKLQVRIMETMKRVVGEEHPDTLTSMNNLASTYWNQGRWKEAEELNVRVMEKRKRVLGEEHPDTLTSMSNLASTYSNQGRWKEAEELEVQMMETKKRVLGEEHPNTLISIANLASTYRDQGQWKEAEELDVRVMETRKRVLGEEHADTLMNMGNLALIYWNQGQWKKAEELNVQMMETSLRVLGEEHPDTLTSMSNLASTYSNQGRWKEAEELEVRVIETSLRVLGEEHPDTLVSMSNLAWIYLNQGQWKKAEELNVHVMETSKRLLGEEHPDTLICMHNLAYTLKYQNRNEEAISLMKRCCELRTRVLGPEHPYTQDSLGYLHKWEDEELEREDEELESEHSD